MKTIKTSKRQCFTNPKNDLLIKTIRNFSLSNNEKASDFTVFLRLKIIFVLLAKFKEIAKCKLEKKRKNQIIYVKLEIIFFLIFMNMLKNINYVS